MEYILAIVIFLVGAAIGSFVHVVVDRYNTGLSFFKGRSFCFSCNNQIINKDLFPIISFSRLVKWRCLKKEIDSKLTPSITAEFPLTIPNF